MYTKVRLELLSFSWTVGLIIPLCSAYVISFSNNWHLNFLSSTQFFAHLSFFAATITADTKQSFPNFLSFPKFFNLAIYVLCFYIFSNNFCGFDLAFCFIGNCPGPNYHLISISFIDWFVLIFPSNLASVSFFSDWSVIIVECSIFFIVHLIFFNQSIPSWGFISSPFVRSIFFYFCFLGPLLLPWTFRKNSPRCFWRLDILCFLIIFLGFIVCLSEYVFCNRWPGLNDKFFSLPLIFVVIMIWFFLSVV